MNCSNPACNKEITSGYQIGTLIVCVQCDHDKKWKRDCDSQYQQNGKEAQDDAKLDADFQQLYDELEFSIRN